MVLVPVASPIVPRRAEISDDGANVELVGWVRR